MSTARKAGHTAVLLSNGQVLVAGGWVGREITASAELYDPATPTIRSDWLDELGPR